MRSRRTFQRWLVASTCIVGFCASAPPARGANGEFVVANCKSDTISFSTRAFKEYFDPGMRVRRACKQEGQGSRTLELLSIKRNGRVRDGAIAVVAMTAPPGTQFKTFTWGGNGIRHDCGFQYQIWGYGPAGLKGVIHNFSSEFKCKQGVKARLTSVSKTYSVNGYTEIVVRVQCHPKKNKANGCSVKKDNYLRTEQAEAVIVDRLPPSVSIAPDAPLALGQWVSGHQPLNYEASDTAAGVRSATALISGIRVGGDRRSCVLAVHDAEIFGSQSPCPNGRGQLDIDTTIASEGTQALTINAADPAGNIAYSPPTIVHLDNTAPGRVDVAVQGGDGWRNTNDFAMGWTNPPEPDRAPIVAATYKLCRADGADCATGDQVGDGLSAFQIAVPGPGEWALTLWRRDAAGNQSDAVASVPVTMRYDPDPPQLGFEAPSPSDPTQVAVDVSDKVSGLDTGAIEISQVGSSVWHELSTQVDGDRLLARIDDAAMPAGNYVLRARAADRAGNEASTDLRLDGQPMALNLPLRGVTTVRAGFRIVKTVMRTVRRHGKAQRIRRRVRVTQPAVKLPSGELATVVGRLVNAAGQGVAGQTISVLSSSSIAAEQLVTKVQTDSDGTYSYAAPGSSSQTLRFAFAGDATMLPAQASLAMTVPALTSLTVNRRRLRNGQTVKFSGALRTAPAPPSGKLLELQVRLPGRWETFQTIRTDVAGHWTAQYHFTRTRGLQRYRFRARLPEEAGYPFAAGGSHALTVQVRG